MEYLIKYSPHLRGKEQNIYDLNGDVLLTITKNLDSASDKEIILDGEDNIVYLVDTTEGKGQHQSTIYDAASNEILTAYLSSTYSGLNMHVSSPNKTYAVTHKKDMSAIHLYHDNEIVATIKLKKTLFGTNYSLDVKPKKDEAFIHLFAIVITKLIEYKSESLQTADAYAY